MNLDQPVSCGLRQLLGLVVALLILGFAVSAGAQEVEPSDRVKSGVLVRIAPDGDAEVIGALRPGDRVPLDSLAPGWNGVTLPDGRKGFVSKSWTVVLSPAPAGDFTIHTVDVGTGLAVFVEGPGFTLVYDGGSNDDRSTGRSNRFLAYLRSVRPNLRVIDHVILSHAHRDHLELLPDLFAAYQVRHVWDSGAVNATCGYRKFLLAVMAEPGVSYHDGIDSFAERTVPFPGCGQPVVVRQAAKIPTTPVALGPATRMAFLHVDATRHHSPNDNSLVVRLDLGSVRVLLTGDAEAGERLPPSAPTRAGSLEAKLLACCLAALRADILFAGHHGSMTSSRSAFVDAVKPDTMIISSGPFPYQGRVLPDKDVVDFLQSRGTVLRTDLNDLACRTSLAKIGTDNDAKPGGCDNILITITDGRIAADYYRPVD